jgi:hypothetical protein
MEMRRRRPIISFSFHLSINRYIPYIAFFSELPLIFRILDASASIRTRCLFKVWQACLSKQLPLCKLEAARWAEKSTANQNRTVEVFRWLIFFVGCHKPARL